VGVTVAVAVGGQALVSLSAQMDAEDARVRAELATRASRLAAACVRPTDEQTRRSCEDAVARAAAREDVVAVRVQDRQGRVLHAAGEWGSESEPWEGPRGASDTSRHLPSPWEDALEYTATAPLTSPAGEVGRVSLRARSAAVPEAVRRGLTTALGMGLVWLVLALGLGAVLVRRILAPVDRLTTLACALARGEDARPPEDPGERPDEIGVLQGALRTLALHLRRERAENERLLGELATSNERLQRRVERVTADLRELSAYLEAVIDSLEEGVLTFDAEARLVHVGKSSASILRGLGRLEPGTPADEVLPAPTGLGDAVRDAARHGHHKELALTVEADGTVRPTPPVGEELAWDGVRALVLRVSPLSREGATRLGAVVTVGDRTREVRAAARQVRHERLVSLGTIGAGLAHELGNYMHTIHGYSALLLRSLDEGSDARADAQAIHDENARAVALLDRFLEFARPREVWVQPEPLDRLVREALEVCAVQLRKGGVTVERAISHTLPEVVCDARLMVQVFVNLILNAVDAMEGTAERKLTLRASILGGPSPGTRAPGEAAPAGRLVGPSETQRVRVEVTDTGPGIAPEDQRRVFEPLYTTKGEAGTGLGLAVCQQVVDRHGGTLSVRSRPGRGATFVLELPTAGVEPHNGPRSAATEAPTDGPQTHGPRPAEGEVRS